MVFLRQCCLGLAAIFGMKVANFSCYAAWKMIGQRKCCTEHLQHATYLMEFYIVLSFFLLNVVMNEIRNKVVGENTPNMKTIYGVWDDDEKKGEGETRSRLIACSSRKTPRGPRPIRRTYRYKHISTNH